MEKPKKEDFEYYQNGLAFKTVNLIEYIKALELYINEIEALNMRSVAVMLKDKHTLTFKEWWNKQDILETDYNKYVNGYQLKKGETIHQIYERELKTNL